MLHADWLSRRAAYHPDRAALVAAGVETSYGQLHAAAGRAAVALQHVGVGAGDRVVVHARNSVQTVELLFACSRLGAILVPVNWRLADPEVAVVLQDAEPALCLADEPGAEQLGRLGVEHRSLRRWADEVAGARGEVPSFPAEEATPWLMLYTSGSTGKPKGVVLTAGSIGWNAINTVVGWGLSEHDRTITAAPFFHTGGWNVLTLPLLYCGGTVYLAEAFDAGDVLDHVEQHGVTVLFGVPTMFGAMAEDPRWPERDLSGLRWAISGGAPCPQPLVELWQDRGLEFKQGFGMTEVGPNCFVNPDGLSRRKPGTVGCPMPHLRMRLVDESGVEVPRGAVGELQLMGPTVTPGYWRRADATAAAMQDGWFLSGDLFVQDEDGHFACVGRRKEMFISGGENVYPAEVEAVLAGLPGVAVAAVVPAPHPTWGEVGHAFLSLRADADEAARSLDAERVRGLCRQQLAGYKVPRHVTVLPEMPLSATGKVDKKALAALAGA